MKLGSRQLKSIDILLNEERQERQDMRGASDAWRRRSMLNEADVYGGMMSEDLGTALATELGQDVSDAASKCLTDFDKIVYKKLATLLASAGGEKVSGTVLQDDLEDFDADGLMTLEQELMTDITMALEKYISELALLASHAKLGPQ